MKGNSLIVLQQAELDRINAERRLQGRRPLTAYEAERAAAYWGGYGDLTGYLTAIVVGSSIDSSNASSADSSAGGGFQGGGGDYGGAGASSDFGSSSSSDGGSSGGDGGGGDA